MASEQSPDKKALPSLQDIIEKVGMGAAQVRFILTGGGVWFADGSELLLISAVTSSVAAEWNLDHLQRGSMVTIVYLGVFCGNLVSGPASDRNGRRQLILASYVGIFVFSIISSFMMNFWSLCFWRFFVGLSFGLGQPPWNVLAAEVTPAKWRLLVNGSSQGLFCLGEIYSAILIIMDDPTMRHLEWRVLLRLGAIPAILYWAAASFFLLQSPFYLSQTGQHSEAQEVLTIMSRDNCLPVVTTVDFAEPMVERREEESSTGEWRKIGSGPLLITTIIMSYTLFVVNLVYYGSLYAFPQILPTLSASSGGSSSAGFQLLLGALWEFPGIVLACIFGSYMPRKPVLKIYCLSTCCMAILFVSGATGGYGQLATIAWHLGYYGLKLMIQSGFVVSCMYVTEVYPTNVRTTGTSINFAAGRVAAMISPVLYEKMSEATGSFAAFFYVLAASLMINFLILDFLPFETFNRALAMDIEEQTKSTYGATAELENNPQ